MKRLLLLLLTILIMTIGTYAQKHHCVFIGTNTGEFQPKANFIIVIGNFKKDQIFKDSSVNIDHTFSYFHTPRGKILLAYIEKNYNKTSMIEFNNNLQILIKKYYITHMALYIRNRRYDKIFYTFD